MATKCNGTGPRRKVRKLRKARFLVRYKEVFQYTLKGSRLPE